MHLPIYKVSVPELNAAFTAFNDAYEETYSWLTETNPGYPQYDPKMMPFSEYAAAVNNLPKEAFQKPLQMQNLMGFAIRHSFGRKEAAGYRKPSKVGLILHEWHHIMRRLGMEWGDRLITESLPAELQKYFEYLSKPALRNQIFLPEDQIEDDNLRAKAIAKTMVDMFQSLESFQVHAIDGSILTVKNQPVMITKRVEAFNEMTQTYEESDPPMTEEVEVSLAAIVAGIKQAGIAIMGRKPNDPARLFLREAIGLASEAGRKMELLARLVPEAFDYKRDEIHLAIDAEKVWLKTVYAVVTIAGKPNKAFADVLELIGEDPRDLEFGSATKLGVILYTLAETLENAWRKAEESRGELFSHKIRREYPPLVQFQHSMGLVKELSLYFINAGSKTETRLVEAKESMDFSLKKKQEYSEIKREIFAQQRVRLHTMFGAVLKSATVTLNTFGSYAEIAKRSGIIDDNFGQYWNLCRQFCQSQLETIRLIDWQQERGAAK